MIHVLHTFANNSSVPFLSWSAQKAAQEGGIRFSFLLMHKERPAMMDEMAAWGFDSHWVYFDQEHRKSGMVRSLIPAWSYIRGRRPDIVHCHMFDDTLPGLIAARAAGVRRRVITRHDTGYHWKYTPRWVFVDRFNARQATDIIAISSEGRDHLVRNERIGPDKITLAPNGIPVDLRSRIDHALREQLRTRLGLTPEHVVVGTVARFIEWKGYRHVVEAARLALARHPELRFVFCGTGDQQAEIRELVRNAGLEQHVMFLGHVPPEEMPTLYDLFDLLLQAPDHEPFGFVYAEAMMCGTPVVSTRTGAARDGIDDGVDGFLVDERSGAALAAGLERALRSDRTRVSLAAAEKAERVFSFDRMWNGYLSVYRRAMERNA